ncbi:PEP-CTERM sorting domain-containing protein [Microcystis aeruginosa]|uniref:PEP-CTERM sorting domain-containing protein n=1 Tax=Microcystis aeruginosa FD4 TaxID=2686288 RepID=A0A857CZQ0_MICAE|nr:PEP-CTERM sorting domain-containing protein [Microcystis aeruginosa]QGZ88803.1 PEP-CTERM sorting domain-containing protein [Microcystis aeruginosa FD4]
MITNISRQLTSGALAIASSVAAFGFAGAAQAQISGTLSITGTAQIDPWGAPDPMLKPLNVTAINGATGQFTDVMLGDVSTPASFALTGTGSGGMSDFDSPSSLANFISIVVNTMPPTGPGPGTVIGNITATQAMGTFAGIMGSDGTTTYTVTGNMAFDEPNGFPDLLGTFSIGFTRSVTGGQVSESYNLSLQKSSVPVDIPEPSAILGILAVAGAGAFARRKG